MLRKLSIRAKLLFITLITNAVALSVAGIAFFVLDSADNRQDVVRSATAHAKIVGANAVASMASGDSARASKILSALRADSTVLAAGIYDQQGRLFAEFGATTEDVTELPTVLPARGAAEAEAERRVEVFQTVHDGVRPIGTVYMRLDLSILERQRASYLVIMLAISALAGLAALVLSLRLQRVIANPLQNLVNAVHTVRKTRDYTLRVPKVTSDEIGELTDGFNTMLAEVEQREHQMQAVNEQLEGRVRERTHELEFEITERGRAEHALAEANATLERALAQARQMADASHNASRAKTEFLANISHEVRTPLNGVIGMADLLLDTDLNKDQSDFAGTIKRSAEALLVIINDILDFSKAESGMMSVEKIPFDPRDLIEEVADLFSQRAAEKNLELITWVDPAMPLSVLGDPGRVRQILSNLTSNAIKFTSVGEITLEARVQDRGFAVSEITFIVRDTGIGIPTERQAAVFDSFTQVDGSTTRRYGGTGLGLTICKQLAELMGGSIRVSSQPKLGSTFTVSLDFPVVEGSPMPRPSLEGLRTLVVDDNATNRRILEQQLRSWGCHAETASSGPEGIRKLRVLSGTPEAFQLVIMDMQMPDQDGQETTRQIRADDRFAEIPIIMLSSIGSRYSHDELTAMGFSAGLLKPVRQSSLYDVLVTLLGHSTPSSEVITATVSHAQYEGTRVLLVEDNPINQKVARQLLRRLGCEVSVADHGQVAVDRVKAGARFDLILMDVQMPVLDGYEATSAIRQLEGSIRTPIIAMTANAMSGDRDRCLAAGMDDYLSKPVKPADMSALLERWIKGSHPQAAEDREAEPGQRDVPPSSPLLDLNHFYETCGSDPDFLAEVIREYLRVAPKTLARIREAVQEENWEEAVRAAHSLKGASRSIGALQVADACLEMEKWQNAPPNLAELEVEALESEIEAVRVLLEQHLPHAA